MKALRWDSTRIPPHFWWNPAPIFVQANAWRTLYDILDNFVDYMPHHTSNLPCAYTHENAQGILDCSFCNPCNLYTES